MPLNGVVFKTNICLVLTMVQKFNNDFTGPIPSGCAAWTDLVSWSCHINHFTGTLPAGIFSNRLSMTYINVNDNGFEGEFPSISGSTQLTLVWAMDNSFTALPTGVLGNEVLATLGLS